MDFTTLILQHRERKSQQQTQTSKWLLKWRYARKTPKQSAHRCRERVYPFPSRNILVSRYFSSLPFRNGTLTPKIRSSFSGTPFTHSLQTMTDFGVIFNMYYVTFHRNVTAGAEPPPYEVNQNSKGTKNTRLKTECFYIIFYKVAAMTAFIACIRFSASSKTILRLLSITSWVTSMQSIPNFL